jgi:hypothetical protein
MDLKCKLEKRANIHKIYDNRIYTTSIQIFFATNMILNASKSRQTKGKTYRSITISVILRSY